jgi:hypothetical protein
MPNHSWTPWLAGATACAASLAAGTMLHAQPRAFSIGDVFIDRNGDTLQIVQCRGEGWSAECEIRRLRASGQAPINPDGWWRVDTLRGSERSWIDSGGQPYSGPPVPPPNARRPADAVQTRSAAVSEPARASAAPGGQCVYTPPPGRVTSASPPSAALFRRVIFDGYARLATGGLTAPTRVGVSFETFQLGAPTVNRVTVDPGRGARRVTDAAPPNAALHPVRATYVVCREFSNGPQRARHEQDFYCFKDQFATWTCGSGPTFPRITQLD